MDKDKLKQLIFELEDMLNKYRGGKIMGDTRIYVSANMIIQILEALDELR